MIQTSLSGGITQFKVNHDTQFVCSDKKTLKFYDFIDKNEKDKQEQEKVKHEELAKQMKLVFEDIDQKNQRKLDQPLLRSYFNSLHMKLGKEFEHAANVSDECFSDVWFEMDEKDTGFVTWHQIKPFIKRIAEHEMELALERRNAEEVRQKKIEERRLKREEEEAKRLEAERLAQENQDDD
mmetsp:Transcript_17518/g.29526  ORF Transcript_17518/g.29526 Transcript_17518/m.29526 type:complete len:181 (+) Transcript_17518:1204-1746(+)